MKIRRATVQDARGVARTHYDCWLTTYKGIMPDDYLGDISYAKREALWQKILSDDTFQSAVFVLEDDKGRVVGHCSCGKARDAKVETDGELYGIYILQEFQKQSWGKQLFMHACEELSRQGFRSLRLGVLAENSSTGFYDRLGGRVLKSRNIEIGGKSLVMLTYAWSDLPSVLPKRLRLCASYRRPPK